MLAGLIHRRTSLVHDDRPLYIDVLPVHDARTEQSASPCGSVPRQRVMYLNAGQMSRHYPECDGISREDCYTQGKTVCQNQAGYRACFPILKQI
jgi:hypothetical protein